MIKSQIKPLLLMIVDQSTWRSREWGDKLIAGQFNDQNIPFTKGNVQALINHLNLPEGKSELREVILSDRNYWDSNIDVDGDPIHCTVDLFLDSDFGILGKSSLEAEKVKADWS